MRSVSKLKCPKGIMSSRSDREVKEASVKYLSSVELDKMSKALSQPWSPLVQKSLLEKRTSPDVKSIVVVEKSL